MGILFSNIVSRPFSLLMKGSRYLLFSLILISVSTPGFETTASAQSSSAKRKSKNKRKKKPSTDTDTAPPRDSLSSSSTRKSSKFIVGHAGLSPQPFIGFGAAAGLVRASGSVLEGSVTISSGKKEFVAARIIHAGARYRMPVFKIGYVGGGLGFRMASGAWNVLSLGGSEYETGSALNAVTLDGAAGAQTKFGSMILGADLIGVSFPLFKLGVKKSALQESDVDLDDEKKQQAIFDSVAAGLQLTILKVGVGISF